MKKKNSIKKEIKKIKKPKVLNFKKKNNQNEVDLWAEIRTNVKPLVKAYHKFSEKRKIAKQKEEFKKLKEEEQQRLKEEESLKIQIEEEKRLAKEKRAKEEKQKKLKLQEEQRLEDKRIIDERDERIRQEQIYRERLIKGDEERIKLLARVSESREEERKLREERNIEIKNKFIAKQNPQDKEQRLKDEEQRLKEKEQRLIDEEQRLKEKEHRLEKDEKVSNTNDNPKKKRLTGTVLWFDEVKGYGFIKREDKEKDIFVHSSAVQNSGLSYLNEAEQLTFEVEYSDKGPSAVNLEKTVNEVPHAHLKIIK